MIEHLEWIEDSEKFIPCAGRVVKGSRFWTSKDVAETFISTGKAKRVAKERKK